MTTQIQRQLLVFLPLFLLLLGGCSSDGGDRETSGNFSASPAGDGKMSGKFPVPPEIEDNVAFWRNVYGEWSRGQVAIHDDEYMGVIYEVARLPGPTLASYSPEQKRFVRGKKARYKGRLETLEFKVRRGHSLSGNDQVLHDKIVDAGGKRALYGASERVHSQRGLRERFRRGLEVSGRYDAAFREIFRSKGLPEDLAYLPHVESSFQAHARSSAGAAGMWQFTRGTGKIYMTVNGTIDERLDPVIAADGAARYLRDAYRKLDSWPLAVTSYNHGQGGMQKAKLIYGDDIGAIVRHYKGPYFKFASRNFYAEFLAAREVAGNPKRYFPEGIGFEKPMSEDRLVLPHAMPAQHVASHYGVSTYRLADLNLHWRKPARSGRANLPAGSTVWLPDGTLGRVASAPTPMPVRVAKAEPKTKAVKPAKAKPAKVAKAKAKPVKVAKAKAKPVKVAKAKAKPVKVAKVKPAKKRKTSAPTSARVHVVKPNETLYRVATHYDLTVSELRRLNRMKSDDNTIRPGQRLRVSG